MGSDLLGVESFVRILFVFVDKEISTIVSALKIIDNDN